MIIMAMAQEDTCIIPKITNNSPLHDDNYYLSVCVCVCVSDYVSMTVYVRLSIYTCMYVCLSVYVCDIAFFLFAI